MQNQGQSQMLASSFAKFYLLLLSLVLASPTLLAAPDQYLTKCSITPTIDIAKTEPQNIGETNNLTRQIGSVLQAEGNMIYLSGQVLDKNCVPVTDALVEIWQANTHGVYQYRFLIKDKSYKPNKALYDNNFIGSGKMRTNNLGQFSFITIMPGQYTNFAPSINVKIKHEDFKNFTTKIYFSDRAHFNDPDIKKIKPNPGAVVANMTKAKVEDEPNSYYINLTLSEGNKYRRF
jgi:protocatechuate 3,4-dioxygenase beta subunit